MDLESLLIMAKNIFNIIFVGDKPKCGHSHGKNKHVCFNWRLGLPSLKTKPNQMLEITLTNEQKVAATLNPTTQKGKPVQLDGPAVWKVVSGDCTVQEVSDDGKTATIFSGDSPGDSEVLIEADANLNPGEDQVTTISDVIKVHVEGAMASNLGLSLGQPELK